MYKLLYFSIALFLCCTYYNYFILDFENESINISSELKEVCFLLKLIFFYSLNFFSTFFNCIGIQH